MAPTAMGEAPAPALEQLRGQLASYITEAKAITSKWEGKEADMPLEVDEKLQGIFGKADILRARINNYQRLADFDAEAAQPTENPLSWRTAAPKEGDAPTDSKSWRTVDINTPFGTKSYRYHVPVAVEAKGYDSAFEAYMRHGAETVKSNYPRDFKALLSGSDTAGGFYISPDMQSDVLKKMATTATIRSLARVVGTSSNLVQFPRIKYTTDNKYTSGMRMTWTGEAPASGSTHRVTDQILGQVNIPVHTAMASQLVHNDLIEDSAYDILGDSSQFLAEAFALGENDAFLNGTGSGRPLGMITQVSSSTDDSTYIPYTASGTSAAISTSGDAFSGYRLVKMYYSLPAQYRARAVWLMNSLTMLEVESLVDAQKRPLIAALTAASITTGEPTIIKGKRAAVDEFVPDIAANAYPILFGDFSGYVVVDRVGFSVQRLTERYAEENQVLLLARKRVGGSPVEAYRLRAMKTATS